MSLKNEKILSILLLLAISAFSLWARFQLPDVPIATHFDAQGDANGYMPRDVALAFGPALVLGLAVVLLWIAPVISPKNALLSRSQPAYGAVQLAIIAFVGVVHVVVVMKALGWPINIFTLLSSGAGILFLIIGNFLPKTRFNYFMGVRTPWTLSDERVWDKTHRLAGPLFMLAGLVIIAAAWLLPLSWQIGALLVPTLAAAMISGAYSYLVSRRIS